MGAAKRRGLQEERRSQALARTPTKRKRMFHLLKLISNYSNRDIGRFIDRRLGKEKS